jgi:diaminopimelate epimerase
MTSSKWQALGNVYLLAEPGPRLSPEAVREACRDESDGLLEVLAVDGATAEIVIWNPDGSQAELSGNGTRIAAKWLAQHSSVWEVRIGVGERVVEARVLPNGEVEQELGAVEVGAPEAVDGVEVVPVSVGTPHAVVRSDPDRVGELGPRLERNPRFPERTNVEVARVDAPGYVSARVWERGVGETPSSGTGAVAVAAATHGDGEVVVSFPGGDLRVHLADGRAALTGPAERIG